MTKAARIHAHTHRMWRWGRVFIPIWIGLVAVLTCAAVVDAAWHFGWGYDWDDALFGVGMIGFGFVFWFLWNGMFKLIRSLNQTFYGPEAKQDDHDQP